MTLYFEANMESNSCLFKNTFYNISRQLDIIIFNIIRQ